MEIIYFTIAIVLAFWIIKRFFFSGETLKDLGIVHDETIPIFGNMWPLISQKEGGNTYFERIYKKFPNEK